MRNLGRWPGAIAAIGMVIAAVPAHAYTRPGSTVRISEPLVESVELEGGSFQSSISADGSFVAFASGNDFLVAPDINPSTAVSGTDIFVWARRSERIELVSVSSRGIQGTAGNSLQAVMDARARHVAFSSTTPNLVDGDTNLGSDVFVHDRTTRETERVSLTPEGKEGPPGSHQPSISDDGRFVAFSGHPDLVPRGEAPPPLVPALSDQDGQDIYVHDRVKNQIERVSVSSEDVPADGVSYCPSISGNGRFVAFTSYGTNLVEDDTNLTYDVFVHDRTSGKTERVSIASDGTQARRGNLQIGEGSTSCSQAGNAISYDGRFVAFNTTASNLVPSDTSFFGVSNDVFVHDRKTGRTERVSVTSQGREAEGGSALSSISDDGRFVAFGSTAGNLFKGDTTALPVPIPLDPVEEVLCSVYPCDEQPLPDYPFGDSDEFIYDRLSGTVELISISHDSKEVSDCGAAAVWSGAGSINRSGRYVSFHSCAANVVADDSRLAEFFRDHDLFLRDRGLSLGAGVLWSGSTGSADQIPRLCVQETCFVEDPARRRLPSDADLLHSSISYREIEDDLFLTIDVDHLAALRGQPGPAGSTPLYGATFSLGGARYEVRAAPTPPSTGADLVSMGLFRCDDGCREVTTLEGGYGTTGERIVVSIPLEALGSAGLPDLTDVSAYSARGTYLTGPQSVLEVVQLLR